MKGGRQRLKLSVSTMKNWWIAFRYHYVPPSIFPVVIGSLVSLVNGTGFSFLFFAVALVTVIINHIALNMTDDYFDYKHTVDQYRSGSNPYSGGSGMLTSGMIKPRQLAYVFSGLYVIVIFFGMYLTLMRGWIVLLFGLIGFLSSIFYTAPPVKLSHHGLGELTMLINFGPILGMGAYYVQAQTLSLEPFIVTLPCGIMLFALIIINEIPDLMEDKQAGKLTLVARFGKQRGFQFYIIGWILTYIIIIIGVILSILPLPVLIGFISIPWIIRSIFIGRKKLNRPAEFMQANLDNIKGNAITSIGIIFGYGISGFYKGIKIFDVGIVILLFFILYLPALLPLLSSNSKK